MSGGCDGLVGPGFTSEQEKEAIGGSWLGALQLHSVASIANFILLNNLRRRRDWCGQSGEAWGLVWCERGGGGSAMGWPEDSLDTGPVVLYPRRR